MQTAKSKPRHSIFWCFGTKTFVANSIVSGVALGYFTITKQFPLMFLVLFLWVLSAATWAEYRSFTKND